MPDPILSLKNVSKTFEKVTGLPFRRQSHRINAVKNVSFDLLRGETLAIVGESGSGKSTLARMLMLLETPSTGQAIFEGQDIFQLEASNLRKLRRHIQMVFQDPWASLNPRRTIEETLIEGWIVNPGLVERANFRSEAQVLLETVGLGGAALDRYPAEFSGGQRQRIAIARALALDPQVLILDEAVSALDVSIQAQILNLLAEIQREREISCLFISHDLSVVRHISNRVGVMYLGELVELAQTDRIFAEPVHDYTRKLLASMPDRLGQARVNA